MTRLQRLTYARELYIYALNIEKSVLNPSITYTDIIFRDGRKRRGLNSEGIKKLAISIFRQVKCEK